MRTTFKTHRDEEYKTIITVRKRELIKEQSPAEKRALIVDIWKEMMNDLIVDLESVADEDLTLDAAKDLIDECNINTLIDMYKEKYGE